MVWLMLAVLFGLLIWVGAKIVKPNLATPGRGDAKPSSAQDHQSPPNTSALQITVLGIEYDYTHHPLFQVIAPMMACGKWDDARRYLQKIAYGIKTATENEQRDFKHIMMAFASVDPLYTQCLRGIAPILAEHPEGIRQTALYPHMAAASDAETARYVLYFADALGAIRREKKGNSYLVFSTDNNPDLDKSDSNYAQTPQLTQRSPSIATGQEPMTRSATAQEVQTQPQPTAASQAEYVKLSPEDFTYPLDDVKHAPFLEHYGRIRSFDGWTNAGLKISRSKYGGVTQRSNLTMYRFHRLWAISEKEREAIASGKRHVTGALEMLGYLRVGVPFDDFVSHPQHYRDFCLGVLAQERGEASEALELFRQALAENPSDACYASKFYELRVANGDLSAPAQELDYFANSVDSMVHSGRVNEWAKLLLKHKDYPEAARVLRRVATLLEDKIAGRLPKGQYSGDDPFWAAHKRDQFRKKIASWSNSTRYAPLMSEIERQGGLPQPQAAPTPHDETPPAGS